MEKSENSKDGRKVKYAKFDKALVEEVASSHKELLEVVGRL